MRGGGCLPSGRAIDLPSVTSDHGRRASPLGLAEMACHQGEEVAELLRGVPEQLVVGGSPMLGTFRASWMADIAASVGSLIFFG